MTRDKVTEGSEIANTTDFEITVQQSGDRWCVYESSIKGLFLETDDLDEMTACIEDIAPDLITNNHHVKESELANIVIYVYIVREREATATDKKKARPRILMEHQLAA